MLTLNHFLGLSAILFGIGLYGLLSRRNLVAILLSIEIMLSAVLINFVAVARFNDNAQGDIFALFVMAMAAAEVAVGLALFLNVFRITGQATTDVLGGLKE